MFRQPYSERGPMTARVPTSTGPVTPGWQNTRLSAADRVEALLQELTLEEKVAQLGSRWPGNDMGAAGTEADRHAPPTDDAGHDAVTQNVAPMQDVFASSGSLPLEEASRHGL